MMSVSNYDRFPALAIPQCHQACVAGWDAIAHRLATAIQQRTRHKTILAIECYPGVDEAAIVAELAPRLHATRVIHMADALRSPEQIEDLVRPYLGGDDPVFGRLCPLTLADFFQGDRLESLRRIAGKTRTGVVLVVGCGATLLAGADILVVADLARWEIQQRFRRNAAGNLGISNRDVSASAKYKRAYFVDWRIADRWKAPLLGRAHYFLDVHQPESPKLAEGDAIRRGLRHATTRPFRLVPFFDPAPWGGQWMKRVCGLDPDAPNYGWCFDGVPEENSLVFRLEDQQVELPAMNLLLAQPRELLGDAILERFGAEFPIRFDLLDTMGGGNLSLQVHPLKEYIRQQFGLTYTQDESYYLLDAGPDAGVFLGLREGIDRAAMLQDLQAAQAGGPPFPAEQYANRLPAHRHDHFLIPAGTVHCSGANSMVLEISATPYIFTFKLWDWARLGLDGRPRPIHLDHGAANIQWDRDARWVRENLVNRVSPIAAGPGWREERTGLHELEFIETRRHWFTAPVPHDTQGTVNVLNLVQGRAAVVESPSHAFEPFTVHYAETFIVPAAVGPYVVRPVSPDAHSSPSATGAAAELATIKAFVRT